MSEIICRFNSNKYMYSYQVEREETPENIVISVYDTREGRHNRMSKISYTNIGEEYHSPFLSWYNLIFCSNYYGPALDYNYMDTAVQQGKKTAATIYHSLDSREGKTIVSKLPADCSYIEYDSSMIYVYHTGKLSDYFDFEKIKNLYQKHGIGSLDWEIVRMYFEKPLSFFGNENDCGFSLQSGGNTEQKLITGLILGYPIESTVSLLT